MAVLRAVWRARFWATVARFVDRHRARVVRLAQAIDVRTARALATWAALERVTISKDGVILGTADKDGYKPVTPPSAGGVH